MRDWPRIAFSFRIDISHVETARRRYTGDREPSGMRPHVPKCTSRTRNEPESPQRLRCPRLHLFIAAAVLVIGAAYFFKAIVPGLAEPLTRLCTRTDLRHNDQLTGIVILGGSVARMEEGMRLAQQFPSAELVAIGAHAAELRLLSNNRLIRANRVRVETSSKSTFENALTALKIAQPGPGERWVLVTSAIHMPRAIGTFSAQGFTVEPWPVYETAVASRYLNPVVWHELGGLVAYRLLGRVTSLFPCRPQKSANGPR